MKDFDWTSFTRRIALKASIQDLYNAWAIPTEIEKWFLKNANYYDRNNRIIAKDKSIESGFTYEWSWYIYEEVEKGKINQANGKDHIQFTFAGDCIVDVRLSTKDEFVIVELTQSNIPTDEISKQNIRLGCDNGWSFYLVNLKSFYENGIDLRNKDIAFRGMVNH